MQFDTTAALVIAFLALGALVVLSPLGPQKGDSEPGDEDPDGQR